MHVLVARLDFHLDHVDSLKDKRRIRKSVLERVRQRFGVSAAEVGSPDSLSELGVALALVGSDRQTLRAVMDRAVDFVVDSVGDPSVVDVEFR